MMDSGNPEQSNTYPARVGYDASLLPPIGGRYVTQDVVLRTVTLNPNDGGTIITIEGRVLLDDGRITQFQEAHTLAASSASKIFDIPMPKGYLLSASVTNAGSGQLHGAIFAHMLLVYASGALVNAGEILAQGYISDDGGISFPYGKSEQPGDGSPTINLIPANVPAAGANWTFTPPLGYLLRMSALRLTLVTSAAVANRLVRIKFPSRGVASQLEVIAPAVQTATTTFEYNFFIGGSPLAVGTVQQAGLPHSYNCNEGAAWVTDVQNIQAADQLSIIGGWYEAFAAVES